MQIILILCYKQTVTKENKKSATNSAYFNKWWLNPESNWGHRDFQSLALPAELSSHDGGTDGDRTRDLLRDRETC